MKMSYNKPEINEVKLAANQAIAACANGSYKKFWTLHDKEDAEQYPSKAAALAAQPDQASSTANQIYPVYRYKIAIQRNEYWLDEMSGDWRDYNQNNKIDGGEIANQKGNAPTTLELKNAAVMS